MAPPSRRTSAKLTDCATMRSDVIGDFQAPYGAAFVERDDMALSYHLGPQASCGGERHAGAAAVYGTQAIGAQHVVDMGEHLAEGEPHLMRIVDHAPEHHRHQV